MLLQVYHGNNREVETKTSYSFNTQHQLPTTSGSSKSHHQLLANQQQALTRPAKAKTSQVDASSTMNYRPESHEHPVYRPTASNNTKTKVHHKLNNKDAQATNVYGGFQPPKQTYGFQPYDDKEALAILNVGTSSNSDSYSSNSQTSSSASHSPSSATSATSEEYLSPNYFLQKS